MFSVLATTSEFSFTSKQIPKIIEFERTRNNMYFIIDKMKCISFPNSNVLWDYFEIRGISFYE